MYIESLLWMRKVFCICFVLKEPLWLFQSLHFTREGRKPSKDGMFLGHPPAKGRARYEPRTLSSQALSLTAWVYRAHQEMEKCFSVLIRNWCSHLIFLRTLCPSHRSLWDTLLAELSSKEAHCLGVLVLFWLEARDGQQAFLSTFYFANHLVLYRNVLWVPWGMDILSNPLLLMGKLKSGGRNQLVSMCSVFLTFSGSSSLSSPRSGSRLFGPWTISIRVSWSLWFLLW